MSEPLVIMGYCDFASSDKIVAALSFLTASGVRYKFDFKMISQSFLYNPRKFAQRILLILDEGYRFEVDLSII